ncbi:MAG: hypothetical protein OJJ21_11725 [Ferrovibrio sp.]|uniref:phosphoribosyltransferase-like protein n=1 Tax=Ferrovibrio sp. TaxID=1917215 RepID=UPI002617A6A9|nr:hypothetical protein [Ferrovibrio sp.]MCW0234258.1 hypothetical protein [Ferrovibrio sp.]
MVQGVVDQARLDAWVAKFAIYRRQPTGEHISAWLNLFDEDDQGFAIRILDNLKLISDHDIHTGHRAGLTQVPDWHENANNRTGKWYFCGYAHSGAKSGHAMLHKFAEANRLNGDNQRDMFVTPHELPKLKLTAADTVVFVDDVSGSGNQVIEYWDTISELIASEARTFLILTAATERALARIAEETELKVIAHHVIDHTGNIFHDDCNLLDADEKAKLLAYCMKADKKVPKGYGDCGLLLVLSHKTPNNTIPVIHAWKPKWKGLFPRILPDEG